MDISDLDLAIRKACPSIHGVSIGRKDDRTTWNVWFDGEPTQAERNAVDTILATFSFSDEPVPTIDRRQCRLWLLQQLGKTKADIESAIATISDPAERETAMIEWEDARAFRHDHVLFQRLAPLLGVPVESLPGAFRAAAKL